MKITNRLAVATILFVSVALASTTLTWLAAERVRSDTFASKKRLLLSELESRRLRVVNYLEQVTNDLRIMAGSRFVQHALIDFAKAFNNTGGNAEKTLQRLYIEENPNPVGRKHLLIMARDGSSYSALHQEYHDWTSSIAKVRDYYDIFLVDPQGNIVYTVFKEDDFATNLFNGKYKDTELAQVFSDVAARPQTGEIYARDFVRYAPSQNKPASFFGTAVNYEGEFVGAIVVQLKPEPFNRIMHFSRSMGESGKTYIVGKDKLLRTRSRFSEEDAVLRTKVDTKSSNAALEGRNGIWIINDYRGVPVLSAYAPIQGERTTWAVLAEIDVDEVTSESDDLILMMVLVSVIASTLAFLLGWLLAGRDEES
ncbi:MAG: hypothetical protein GXP23_11885 [Gammaproteobacteria bacterium]|nr:hypothetical protein [Gammaproteobacteria bacterium]